MSTAGVPLDGAETAGDARTGTPAGVESPETAQGNSGRESWAAVEALAALLEPDAFNDAKWANPDRREETRQRALAHAAKVLTASDYRRVVEDDDTIERLAQAMWFGPPAWSARIVQEEYAPTWRAKARAVVRALREDT